MFLDELVITDKFGDTIRTVKFKKGLNLILGISDKKGTTNNIGKTTLIRCIDFCLGGKIDQIYMDKEFKNKNMNVYGFLQKNQPSFQLKIKDDLASKSITYTVSRTVHFNNNQIKSTDAIIANDENIEFKDFNAELKKIFFGSESKKPTFRELIAKFIRKDEQQVSNVLKYLSPFTQSAEYEKIHLFLFGFNFDEVLQKKNDIEKELKKRTDILNALKSQFNITDLVQILNILKQSLGELTQKRDEFKIDEKYEIEEEELRSIQLNLINLEKNISDLQLKKAISEQQCDNIKKDFFDQDVNSLKLMYEEVGFYAENMHKSFEEVVTFHNKMLKNELDYTISKIKQYDARLNELAQSRQTSAQKYSEILERLSKTGSLAEYTKLNEQIEKISEKKGRAEQQIEDIQKNQKSCDDLRMELQNIVDQIDRKLTSFNEKLALFNSFFTSYSKKLYDQEFFLSYEQNNDMIKFSIKDMNGNEGPGKKQAIISAFDLAYINFINALKLKFPKFSAIDKVEIVDIDKLTQLFDISNEIEGQFIIPIIYDKIENIYEKYKKDSIITLSESNKFFKF
jgi:hypothetical protein|nr:hypothetical protein [uncultured Campylobacter sp.]